MFKTKSLCLVNSFPTGYHLYQSDRRLKQWIQITLRIYRNPRKLFCIFEISFKAYKIWKNFQNKNGAQFLYLSNGISYVLIRQVV
jgi:hypothetical protein